MYLLKITNDIVTLKGTRLRNSGENCNYVLRLLFYV